jgi:regulation of enolase protein 1 (concanavalin A-like superfamily)
MKPDPFALFLGGAEGHGLRWHCEPTRWAVDPQKRSLVVYPDAKTDFWQRTHYGFEADNGHLLHVRTEGDFILTARVTSKPKHQYDQAGLMVRISPACWLKTSVEFEPHGANRLGAVVTNERYSDWSTQPLAKDVDTVWFRVRAESQDCIVETSIDGARWEQIRMAHLHERASVDSVSCGVYACSPKQSGFMAEFSSVDLHTSRG